MARGSVIARGQGAVLKYAEDLQMARETGLGALATGDD